MKEETKQKIISEFQREKAIKGGKATLKKYGRKHFREMRKKVGAKQIKIA